MRSIFDGGSRGEDTTWVLTPYDQRLERLRHAKARIMSIPSILERTRECPDGDEAVREVFRTQGTVKGMWKFMDQPYTKYMPI